MTDMREITTMKMRRRRRWVVGVAAALVACVVAWQIVVRIIQVDRYRGLVQEKLAAATGLPVTIGKLDLALRPLPMVFAYDVKVGADSGESGGADSGGSGGALKAEVRRVAARPRLRALFRGRVEIPDVALTGLEVTVPRESGRLVEEIKRIKPKSPDGAKPGLLPPGGVTVGRVHAEDARLYRAGSAKSVGEEAESEPDLVFDVNVDDVLSDTVAVQLEGTAAAYGEPAKVTISASIARKPETRITGTARLEGLDSTKLPALAQVPQAIAALELALQDAPLTDLSGTLSGEAQPGPKAPAGFDAFAGGFTARAWLKDGVVVLNDFAWQSPGVKFTADATLGSDTGTAFHIFEGTVTARGLGPMVSLYTGAGLHAQAAEGAAIEFRDLLSGRAPDGTLRFVKGNGSFRGLDLVQEDGSKPFSDVRGEFQIVESVIDLKMSCDGMALAGTVRPDLSLATVSVDFSGEAALSRERLATFLPTKAVESLKGTIRLERLSGTFARGVGLPADLAVNGRVTDASLSVATPAFSDTFKPLDADFKATTGGIDTRLRAHSATRGDIEAEGRYDVAKRIWTGRISADLEAVGRSFVTSAAKPGLAQAVLALYGPSQFQAQLTLPSPESPAAGAVLEREGAPALKATVSLEPDKPGLTLKAVEATASVPLDELKAAVPSGVAMGGMARATFACSGKDAFSVDVDVTDADIRYGTLLDKKPGVAAGAHVTGTPWTPQTLTITCLGESVEGRIEQGRVRFDALDVQLTPLAPLFAQGAAASGRITGSAATSPTSMELALDGITFALAPGVALGPASGAVSYADAGWAFRDIVLRGGGSDCTADAELRDGLLRGSISGKQLDLNAVAALMNEAKRLAGAPKEASQSPSKRPLQGSVAVDVDAVLYRRARIEDAHCVVALSAGDTVIRDLSFRPYTGAVTGQIRVIHAAAGSAQTVHTDLQFDGVDARVFDELAFEEPRRFVGSFSGTVRLAMPTGQNIDPRAGLDGDIAFEGRGGSFGTLGIATRILTVLRTTEIVRLRLPSLRDEGLTFDTCLGKLTFANGVMTANEFRIENPSLAMTAAGTVDFAQRAMDLMVDVDLLGAVTSLAEQFPALGRAMDSVEKFSKLRLHVTGPPDDPTVRPVRGELVKSLADTVTRVPKAGEDAKDDLKGVATDILRNILGNR